MIGTSPKVICRDSGDHQSHDAALVALWDRLEREGWFQALSEPRRVVIQVGQANRSEALLHTVRSLATRIASVNARVEIVDPTASADCWTGWPVRHLETEDTVRVSAIAVPHGLVVPRLWFESFALVTVGTVSPSATSRVASIMEAQADPLIQLGNRSVPRAMVYEAHRLAASDLAVVCCSAEKPPGASDRTYWAASTSDTALEQVILRAAGIESTTAPHFRELLRHELAPPPPQVEGALPGLQHMVAPTWLVQRATMRSNIQSTSQMLSQDMRNLQGNLHKIPAFLRRRVATWRAQRNSA